MEKKAKGHEFGLHVLAYRDSLINENPVSQLLHEHSLGRKLEIFTGVEQNLKHTRNTSESETVYPVKEGTKLASQHQIIKYSWLRF